MKEAPLETHGDPLERVPVRLVASEILEGGQVVLLRPKFLSPRLGWLQRLLPRPFFRVRLDATGSCIWEAVDGARSVREVCRAVRERVGPAAEPVEERTWAFLRQLAQGGFLRLDQNR